MADAVRARMNADLGSGRRDYLSTTDGGALTPREVRELKLQDKALKESINNSAARGDVRAATLARWHDRNNFEQDDIFEQMENFGNGQTHRNRLREKERQRQRLDEEDLGGRFPNGSQDIRVPHGEPNYVATSGPYPHRTRARSPRSSGTIHFTDRRTKRFPGASINTAFGPSRPFDNTGRLTPPPVNGTSRPPRGPPPTTRPVRGPPPLAPNNTRNQAMAGPRPQDAVQDATSRLRAMAAANNAAPPTVNASTSAAAQPTGAQPTSVPPHLRKAAKTLNVPAPPSTSPSPPAQMQAPRPQAPAPPSSPPPGTRISVESAPPAPPQLEPRRSVEPAAAPRPAQADSVMGNIAAAGQRAGGFFAAIFQNAAGHIIRKDTHPIAAPVQVNVTVTARDASSDPLALASAMEDLARRMRASSNGGMMLDSEV